MEHNVCSTVGVLFNYGRLVECGHENPFSPRTFHQPDVAADNIQDVSCASLVGDSLIGEILNLWTQYESSLDNIQIRHPRALQYNRLPASCEKSRPQSVGRGGGVGGGRLQTHPRRRQGGFKSIPGRIA